MCKNWTRVGRKQLRPRADNQWKSCHTPGAFAAGADRCDTLSWLTCVYLFFVLPVGCENCPGIEGNTSEIKRLDLIRPEKFFEEKYKENN